MGSNKKSIDAQLQEIGIDLIEGVSFDSHYCPCCEKPVATTSGDKPYELTCRFCEIIFSIN